MDFFDLCSHPRAETYPYPFPKGEAGAVVSHLFGAVWFSPFWRGLFLAFLAHSVSLVALYSDLADVSWDCLMCLGFAAPLSERGWGYVSKK